MSANITYPSPRHQFLAEIAPQYFDVAEVVKCLDGYDDLNLLAVDGQGQKMVLKMTSAAGEQAFLNAQNEVLNQLDRGAFPHPRHTHDGKQLVEIQLPDGKTGILRALDFLPGTFFAEIPHTSALFHNFGTFMGQLNRKLQAIDHLAIRQRRTNWDMMYALDNFPYLDMIPDPGRRRIAASFFQQFREQVLPLRDALPMQTTHHDANEWNVLASGDQITGLIDFGDMAYAWRIAEVAIAISYGILAKEAPLDWAVEFLRGYHAVNPLQEQEIEVLYLLIAVRMVVSVSNSAKNRQENPDNSYIFVTEARGWELLEQWLTISPIAAEQAFRDACGFPPRPLPAPATLLDNRQQHFSRAMSLSYGKRPLQMLSAQLQYMYAADGRSYLDCVNNIMHVGHCHPRVVQAGQQQLARLNTNTRYLYEGLTAYAEALTATLPAGLNKVFFVNSGSAATDLAMRIARTYTGRQAMLVLAHGYHGNTESAIGVSAYKYQGQGGQGAAPHVYEAPLPDLYRGPWRAGDPEAAGRYAAAATDLLRKAENDGQPIAAFIAESIVGCGGQVPLPPGYLPEVYAQVRARGGLCIADEVQTGFARVGSHFWAFEQSGVVPDLVILGKPIGNGHPMAAVVCTDALAEAFANGMEFFSSFGGNPVSCAIGQAVLDVIRDEEMQAHAARIGDWLLREWRGLEKEFSVVGNVRGSGLFLGMEFIQPGTDTTPNAALAEQIILQMREQGILLSTDGPHHNVLKFKPPMPFSLANAERLTTLLRGALTKTSY